MPATIDALVEDIVTHIHAHNGPGPTKKLWKRVPVEPLRTAIDRVKSDPESNLDWLQPYHFEEVLGIWDGDFGKEQANLMLDHAIPILVEKYGSINKLIKELGSRELAAVEFPVEEAGLVYTPSRGIVGAHNSSQVNATIHWLHSRHPEYSKIRPWHFRRVPNSTWDGKQGKKYAREVVNHLVQHLLKENKWTITDLIQNIKFSHVSTKLYTKTPDGKLEYTAMAAVEQFYDSCVSDAILDWIHSKPKRSKSYEMVRPWHFQRSPRLTWQGEAGKKNTREVIDQVAQQLLTENNWTITDLIQNIKSAHFYKTKLQTSTPDGELTFTATSAFLEYCRSSASSAILDWIQDDPERFRNYEMIRPWHFASAPNSYWQGALGKVHALDFFSELVDIRKSEEESYQAFLSKITREYLLEPLTTVTPDKEIETIPLHILRISFSTLYEPILLFSFKRLNYESCFDEFKENIADYIKGKNETKVTVAPVNNSLNHETLKQECYHAVRDPDMVQDLGTRIMSHVYRHYMEEKECGFDQAVREMSEDYLEEIDIATVKRKWKDPITVDAKVLINELYGQNGFQKAAIEYFNNLYAKDATRPVLTSAISKKQALEFAGKI